MRIVYYQNSDGKIMQHSLIPAEWSDDDVRAALDAIDEARSAILDLEGN